MRNLARMVDDLGGVAPTRELLGLGVSGRQLSAAVLSGALLRPRQGWYLPPYATSDVIRAVRVGGRLASVSAALTYGLATPHEYPLHVQVAHEGSRLRTEASALDRLADHPDDTTRIHRGQLHDEAHSDRWRVSLRDAMIHVLGGEDAGDALACLDSALHVRALLPRDLDWLRARLPERAAPILEFADGAAESFPESVCRWKLHAAGIETRIQVWVLGERRLDILIGDRLVIEVDGADKYLNDATPEEVARRVDDDRQRDAFLEALGYHVIRVSYRMVMFDWPATLAMILAIMDRGDHLARRKSMHREA